MDPLMRCFLIIINRYLIINQFVKARSELESAAAKCFSDCLFYMFLYFIVIPEVLHLDLCKVCFGIGVFILAFSLKKNLNSSGFCYGNSFFTPKDICS